jgi:hypothetical protein
VGALLAASVGLLVGGVALLVVGRWRGSSAAVSAGVTLAAVGALLLVAFVAIGMTMEPAGAA